MSKQETILYSPSDVLAKERELAKWAQKRDIAAQKVNEAAASYNNINMIVKDLQRQLGAMRKAMRS